MIQGGYEKHGSTPVVSVMCVSAIFSRAIPNLSLDPPKDVHFSPKVIAPSLKLGVVIQDSLLTMIHGSFPEELA